MSENPGGNYMFKVNNRSIRTRCEKCLKLQIKTPKRRHFSPCASASFVNFEQGNAGKKQEEQQFKLVHALLRKQ